MGTVTSIIEPSKGLVMVGDLLVALQGGVVTSVKAVEAKLEELKAEMVSNREPHLPLKVNATLLRQGQEINITLDVPLLGSDGARRVVCWHGLVLHEIPRALCELGGPRWSVHCFNYTRNTFRGFWHKW